jgi:putative protein kinase ArgK-like GTPase of G3E family
VAASVSPSARFASKASGTTSTAWGATLSAACGSVRACRALAAHMLILECRGLGQGDVSAEDGDPLAMTSSG